MKIKTSELSGAALDWAVAQAEGRKVKIDHGLLMIFWPVKPGKRKAPPPTYWEPTHSWAQGGPIIERECMEVRPYYNDPQGQWCAEARDGSFLHGPTPLIAAMRCKVASHFGDEVDVPNELMED